MGIVFEKICGWNGSLRMADSTDLQQIVERAVAQVLDRQLPKLQAELVARVTAELPAVLAAVAFCVSFTLMRSVAWRGSGFTLLWTKRGASSG